jgi:3-oxoacyl-[acyl-carrier protein] reductase
MRALITGVNSLVNKALLAKLVEMEYEVVAHYHSENDITELLKKEYVDANVKFLQADFSNRESFLKFFTDSSAKKFDVIVNGAADQSEGSSEGLQLDFKNWQNIFATNTLVPGFLMENATSTMTDDSVIINISSTYGQKYMGAPFMSIYSASKAALDSLTITYAKKLSENKIRVVGIAPGWIRSAWNIDMDKKDLDTMLKPQLTGKLIEPEEIADLMEAIINNKSINATTIVIDGGLSAPIIKD